MNFHLSGTTYNPSINSFIQHIFLRLCMLSFCRNLMIRSIKYRTSIEIGWGFRCTFRYL